MLFGATVIRVVKYILPYSSLVINIGYLVVCGDQKARNNDNMLSFAQQNLKYPLQTREKSSWKTLGGFATSGFSLGFFSRLSCIFVDTASRITAYCPIGYMCVEAALKEFAQELYLPRHLKPLQFQYTRQTSLSTDAGKSFWHELGVVLLFGTLSASLVKKKGRAHSRVQGYRITKKNWDTSVPSELSLHYVYYCWSLGVCMRMPVKLS